MNRDLISRRKFVTIAGSALALAGIPAAARLAVAEDSAPVSIGGITPARDFYVTSYGGTPQVDTRQWRLRIKGLVKNPIELTWEQITAQPNIDERLTLECIGNPPGGTAIGNARWTGVRLKPLLDRAQVKSKAVWTAMRAADGYHTGLPAEELLREENFLPYLINGEPLPAEHGFPLRIMIPGKYGMKQPKWITELEFTAHETPGYWEARGWSNSAWRKVNSGFFSPRVQSGLLSIFDRTARVKAPVDIYGWALAGPSGIRRVEVSADGGASWNRAELIENKSPYVWTVWKYRFAPGRGGDYIVSARATDGKGITQPVSDAQSGNGMSGQPRLGITITSA